jgi:predicted ATPase/class 3 adenylate cyclase
MSDIRTLLLTDVVDSTKLAEAIGDAAMAEVWVSHDRAARDLLVEHRGREIDKTDGMLMLFDEAADAVSYALAYHHALAELPVPLKARAGIHVGPVMLRKNTAEDVALGAKPLEVEGLAKPTTARIMSLAQGAQTLITAEAHEALGESTLRIESHGFWMVKGIPEPIELFEVGDNSSPFAPPPDSEKVYRVVRDNDWWLPVKEIPHNLPHLATAFVGREREIGEVRAALEKARLVTLLGMGGLGKTRLAVQSAAGLLHKFSDGVWFLDLSPLRDEALVASEAAQLMGVKAEPDRPVLQSICMHLKDKKVLLVIDNCEHLMKPSADLANAVLRAAPNVRIIATSREALHVPGEQNYPVQPLPLPARGASVDDIARSTAVQLFVARAQQSKPSFVLDASSADSVAELVARLEGIPLALELAAARVRSLSVGDINNRLKDRFKILTGGARVLQERQQTLKGLVDWSYDLLQENEKKLFARLGVFVGGFDLAASEAICGADPLMPEDVLDLLASLVDKSLVMLDESQEYPRYRMLETIREYASGKLAENAEEKDATARAHCDYFFAFAKQARDGMRGAEQGEWIQRIEPELDNIRAAIALSLSGAVDAFLAVKIIAALTAFWLLRGYATEVRAMLRTALALPAIQESSLAQAWALYAGASLAEAQSDHAEARKMLEACLELRRALGNQLEIAATLSTLSLARLRGGDTAGAEEGEQEALKIFRSLGNRYGEAIGLLHLGQICHRADKEGEAHTYLQQCLAVAQQIKNKEVEGECHLLLGEVAYDAGQFADAENLFKRSFTVCKEAADKRGEANATRWLGKCDFQRGAKEMARSRLTDSLRAYATFELWAEALDCIEDLALLMLETERGKSVRLMSAVSQARERLQLRHTPKVEGQAQERLAWLREVLGEKGFIAQWEQGKALDIREAIAQAQAPAEEPALAA